MKAPTILIRIRNQPRRESGLLYVDRKLGLLARFFHIPNIYRSSRAQTPLEKVPPRLEPGTNPDKVGAALRR